MSKIFQEKFVQPLDKFGIKGTWLSERSGVSIQGISRYRSGTRDIYVESFAKMFLALPIEAKQSFLEKLLGGAIATSASSITLTVMIEHLDPNSEEDCAQAKAAFKLIADKFIYPSFDRGAANSRENTDERCQLASLESP